MGRKWEIEHKLQDAIRTKELDMIKKHKKLVDDATDALYRKWKILNKMKALAMHDEQIERLVEDRDALRRKVEKLHDVGYWGNFEKKAQDEALRTIPVFKNLYILQEKLELAILFASSPKQMVKVYEDFIKEIKMIG